MMHDHLNYDILISPDMTDADLTTAGVLILGNRNPYVFHDNLNLRWVLQITDEMPTMCGGQEHNVEARDRQSHGLTYLPQQARHLAEYRYCMQNFGIQLLNLHADTQEHLDLLIRCLWLAIEKESPETSLRGAYTPRHPNFTASASLLLHTDRWDRRDEMDEEYELEGYYCEDDDAQYNFDDGGDGIDLADGLYDCEASSCDSTQYLCEWYESNYEYSHTILEKLALNTESEYVTGAMITSNFGCPEGKTFAVISAIVNDPYYLNSHGWVVVHPDGWATNPNEREHYIAGVFLCRRTGREDQLITSLPTLSRQMLLPLEEAA